MLAASGSESIGEPQKVLFVNLIEDRPHRVLNDFVLQGSNAQWSLSSVRFGYVGSLGRSRSICALVHAAVQIRQPLVQVRLVFLPCHSVYSRRGFTLQCVEAVLK